jgi:hypothetical protein
MAAIGVQLVKYILHLPGRSAWPRRGARLLVSGFIARRAVHGGRRSGGGVRLTVFRLHRARRRFAGEHQPWWRSSSGGCP